MEHALKVGFLAFDSTRISATDVDFPIDIVLYRHGTFQIVRQRYEHGDLAELSEWWQARLRDSVQELPADWVHRLLDELPAAGQTLKFPGR